MVWFIAMCASCVPSPGVKRVATLDDRAVTRTRVVLLGTGTPNANPDRSGPAVAIVVDGTPYLVDCGPGVVRRAAAAHASGVAALEVTNLRRLFVTHLHSDHTVGLADLILTPWVLGRDEPLAVYGPPGIAAMTEHILAAYEQDIRIRVDGLEPANDVGYRVEAHEIGPGVVYHDDKVVVTAFAVEHGSWEHAFGFRFDTLDRVVVVSGDTTPSRNLIENAKGCDVLIHEVYSQSGFDRREPQWQRYHSRFHTSTTELARIAETVQPRLLILYHQLLWGSTEGELLDEIRRGYDGIVVSGRDLDVY